jgi:ketosteroid isomerase-like protein
VIDAVKAADQAWEKAFAGHDTAAAVDAVESSGSILSPNAPIATGPEAIRNLFAGFYALPGMTIDWEIGDVQASSSGDMAVTRGTYQLTYNDPKGKPVVDQGKYATVWRKQPDGRWKVLLDVFNSDLPLAGS